MFRNPTPRRVLPRRSSDGDRFDRQASKLRRRALSCEADGRIREAVAAWTDLNRLQPQASTEEHLVDLRCDHRAIELGPAPTDTRPRPADDPFPQAPARLPELHAADLSVDLLAG